MGRKRIRFRRKFGVGGEKGEQGAKKEDVEERMKRRVEMKKVL